MLPVKWFVFLSTGIRPKAAYKCLLTKPQFQPRFKYFNKHFANISLQSLESPPPILYSPGVQGTDKLSDLLKTLKLERQEGLRPDLCFKMSWAIIPNSSPISTLSSHAAIQSLKKNVSTAAETPGNLLSPVISPHAVKCSPPALISVPSEAGQWTFSLPFYDSTVLHTLQS